MNVIELRAPRSILIHGAAGGVATAVIQLAVADGIQTIGTVSSEQKRAFARAAVRRMPYCAEAKTS